MPLTLDFDVPYSGVNGTILGGHPELCCHLMSNILNRVLKTYMRSTIEATQQPSFPFRSSFQSRLVPTKPHSTGGFRRTQSMSYSLIYRFDG